MAQQQLQQQEHQQQPRRARQQDSQLQQQLLKPARYCYAMEPHSQQHGNPLRATQKPR
jgi:hypothetical protein